MLTTGATDSFIGTPKNDSFTGTQATYQTGDLMIDATTTDNDILTLNTTSNITAVPTVSGIERIVINASKAGAFAFAGTNVSGANTVTVNRLDLLDGAIDGTGAVSLTGMRATTFVAGDKVSNFSVAMDTTSNIATAATVNATAATGAITVTNINYAGATITGINDKDLTETAAATGSKATANISGELTVTNAVDELTLVATAATDVTVTAIGDTLTLAGDADIILNMGTAALSTEELVNNATGKVTVVVDTATTALDLTDVGAVTSVVLDADINAAIVVADSQLITTKTNQTKMDVDNVSGETTGSFKFAVLDNENATAAVTLGAVIIGANDVFESVYLDATADKLTAASLDVNDADVILTGAKDITLGTVTNASSIISTNTSAVSMTVDGSDVAGGATEMLVALGDGNDTLVVNGTTATFTVQTGKGDDTLTITDAAADSVFTTNEGKDTVTIANNVTGSISLNTGTGDDTVIYDEATTLHKVNLGEGNNTLKLSTTVIADTEFTLGTGNNKIMVTGDADITDADVTGNVSEINLAASLDITSEQFNEFGAFSLTGATASVLTIDATGATVAQTIDASTITLGFGVTSTVAITASTKGDTITGTIGDDAITLSATSAADTIINTNIAGNGTDTIANYETGKDVIKISAADINALIGSDVFAAGDVIGTDAGAFISNDFSTTFAAGGAGTFLFDETTKTLYFDVLGDTADTDGSSLAGNSDDIAIAITTGVDLAAADIVFIA